MLRHFPNGRTARFRIAVGTALCASLLAAAVTAPSPSVASGDDRHSLTERKAALGHQLNSSQADLDEISGRLLAAQGDLDSAVSDLAEARTRLSELQTEVQRATARDQRMQQALDLALQRLADAQADLRRGQATVASQRDVLAGYAVSNAPVQMTQLSTLGLLFGSRSTQQALDRVQAARSALDSQLSGLQRLQANQVLLHYTEQRVQQATDQVAADRAAAAEHLTLTTALEADAAAAEVTVEQQVSDLQVRRDTLSAAKHAELARIATMERERNAVEARLRAIAERRAAARDAAARQSSSGGSSTQSVNDGGFLSYPVHDTYITSPYGMRMHPILHIYKLHDGTDFHAPCGSPVYAAADGQVRWEYYNGGYGNVLLIDHGVVSGVSLQTSYNHLTSFVAGVGQQVSRGQLIAYSGTTGYSTGCHLHFMVYVNGSTVDPVTWL